MICPHCGIAFHETWKKSSAFVEECSSWWGARGAVCPSCNKVTIELECGVSASNRAYGISLASTEIRVYPNYHTRPVSQEVPSHIKEDYDEAVQVLPFSSKASATLARRCLQEILHQHGYIHKDLAQQITDLLNETDATKAIPSSLRTTVDAIRAFGNFSAHAITDQTTLQVIPVESGEAEWCLDILDEMFDYYYVKPAKAAQRKAMLDAKLISAGKPASKS